MHPSSLPHRQHLDRIRGALERVRKVLGDLDQHQNNPATSLDRTTGPVRAGMPQGADRDDLLRPHEAARRLHMPLRKIYAAVRDHRLPATRIGRFLWFRGEDVDTFAKQWLPGGPPAGPDSQAVPPRAGSDRHAAKRRPAR